MSHIDLRASISNIVTILNGPGAVRDARIHLAVPSGAYGIQMRDGRLESVIQKMLLHAVLESGCDDVQVEIREHKAMKGLESFFGFSPRRWIFVSVVFQCAAKFEISARVILEKHGYRCREWIGNEKSDGQLGAYCLDAGLRPDLFLYLLQRGIRVQCDLLIPEPDNNADALSGCPAVLHSNEYEIGTGKA